MPEPQLEPDWVYAPDPPACPVHHYGMEWVARAGRWECVVEITPGKGEGATEISPIVCGEYVTPYSPCYDDLGDE